MDNAGKRADVPPARLLATIHPSAVLRADDQDKAYEGLVADLTVVARALPDSGACVSSSWPDDRLGARARAEDRETQPNRPSLSKIATTAGYQGDTRQKPQCADARNRSSADSCESIL